VQSERTDVPFSPAPVHRALDRVTSILLELQQLQRQVERDLLLPSAFVDETIGEIERRLRRLSAALEDARDGAQTDDGSA
jgi:hypothetical protein